MNALTITGFTTKGSPVVGGVFQMYDTFGMPLEVVLDMMKARDVVVDWVAFWTDATNAGWKHTTITSRVAEAVGDVYGTTAREHVVSALERLGR